MCFSDTKSESNSDEKELHLNFMALIGQEDEHKLQSTRESGYEEDDDDLDQYFKTEYKRYCLTSLLSSVMRTYNFLKTRLC